MKVEARVGVISGAAGSLNPLRSNVEGALVTLNGGGKYTEAVLQGRVFAAANQAAVACTAALATTYTGLVLVNPSTSGKKYVLMQFGFAMTVVAQFASVFGLMTGLVAAGTAALVAASAPRNRLVGGAASTAIVDNGCDLGGTPVLEQVFAQISTAATTVAGGSAGGPSIFDLDGSLILTPGSYVAAYSTVAMTAAPIFHFMWEEIAA